MKGIDASADRRVFDRRFYAAAALLFSLIVLIGFGRTYYFKSFFDTPPLPAGIVHVHGLLMSIWVALFIAQVALISARRVRVHQRLGYAAIGLAVLIIVTGLATALRAAKFGSRSTPPDIPPLVFLAVPFCDLVMFALFFGGAIYYRRTASAHKSLMLMTAINFLPPALARIPIASLQGLGPLWFFGAPTVLALLCLALDWRRRGHVNKVLLVAIVLLVASYAARLAIMTTDAWRAFATWMVGFV